MPVCNGGSCVDCLNKALIWFSAEDTHPLYGTEYCKWTVFFPPENWRWRAQPVIFPPFCSPFLKAASDVVFTWTKIHSSKLYWEREQSCFHRSFWALLSIQKEFWLRVPDTECPVAAGPWCIHITLCPPAWQLFGGKCDLLWRDISKLCGVEIFWKTQSFRILIWNIK